MKKIFSWLNTNLLFVYTLFLLAFIPLYPKLPLVGVTHTWVYIRFDDVAIVLAYILFGIQFLRKKSTIKTPLTVPIVLFWIVGLISTVLAIIFIFPSLLNVFPQIAFLYYLRHIEYIGLFFLAFSAIKDKKNLPYVIGVLTATLLAVVFYGIGQKQWGFPAFLTMNEEFAKGIPLRLSALGRIPSTFAGHYDLAAYLVMIIPILGSMFFGFKNIYIRITMVLSAFAGLILLLLTASRTSFLVYLATIAVMLSFQKRKWLIIPVFIVSIITLSSFQGISQRFGDTISSADVVYDARTNQPIGIATNESEPGSKNKIVIKDIQSNGESLPQGSGFIGLPTQQQTTSANSITYKTNKLKDGTESTEIRNVEGDFIVRKSLSIDISATTRFQGEWPRAIDAFKRNLLLGSGYSSISLATDGNYVRMLGETGLLGLFTFVLIFIFLGIYTAKVLPDVDSKLAKSFIYGVLAGIVGLALNAILIDVFEASKVAYVLWLLVGVAVGVLRLYQKGKIDYAKEVKNVLFSFPAIVLYLFSGTYILFSMIVNNFFVGDDFTWLKWVATAPQAVNDSTKLLFGQIIQAQIPFFTDSQGFFYRPGTKVFFYFLYIIGQFSPFFYHVASIFFHALVTILLFFLATRILKSRLFGAICAMLFLVLSIHFETVFWISSIGHVITSLCMLISLFCYIAWKEKKKVWWLVFSLVFGFFAPLFHEYGATNALLIIGYDLVASGISLQQLKQKWFYLLYLLEIPLYWWMRASAHSEWFGGDYSYNLAKLPFNILGNILGYIGITFGSTHAIPLYDGLRNTTKNNIPLVSLAILIILAGIVYLVVRYRQRISDTDKKVIGMSLVFFIVPLLPFLGLGNITPRYDYLASFGLLLFVCYVLQKLFFGLYNKQRVFSYILLLLLIPFVYFQIVDLQRINGDWAQAGMITNRMMSTIGLNYKSSKTQLLPRNPTFFFVNVPIRYGDAWVFPVGLPDAIWFVFQQEHVTVKQVPSVQDALQGAKTVPAKIFEFTPQGDIEEIVAM